MAELPPLLMTGVRFLVAGALLGGIARMRDERLGEGRAWGWSFVTGALLFGGGIGGVALASQWVPSSIAALCIATVPL